MKITMDMSSYEIERDEIKFGEYDGAHVNTVRNPAVEPVCGLQEIESAPDMTRAVVSAIVWRKMHSWPE